MVGWCTPPPKEKESVKFKEWCSMLIEWSHTLLICRCCGQTNDIQVRCHKKPSFPIKLYLCKRYGNLVTHTVLISTYVCCEKSLNKYMFREMTLDVFYLTDTLNYYWWCTYLSRLCLDFNRLLEFFYLIF